MSSIMKKGSRPSAFCAKASMKEHLRPPDAHAFNLPRNSVQNDRSLAKRSGYSKK